MAASTCKRAFKCCSSMAAVLLALALCVLTQASLSSAAEYGFAASLKTPQFPSLPTLSLPKLPPLPLPRLDQFTLPPLPSTVIFPGAELPKISAEKPLESLHLPALPPVKIQIPSYSGFKLPSETIFPPLPSFKLPAFSLPPIPTETFTLPKLNPNALTIPGFTVPKFAFPPTSFSFPRRLATPKTVTKLN